MNDQFTVVSAVVLTGGGHRVYHSLMDQNTSMARFSTLEDPLRYCRGMGVWPVGAFCHMQVTHSG